VSIRALSVAAIAVAAGLWVVLAQYVAQQRYIVVGMCPPGIVGQGPGLLIYDARHPAVACLPLPMPRDTINPQQAPKVPS
jgi:hypothetical protein